VVQLVEALRYKPEGCGFDYRWGEWNYFIDLILLGAIWTWGRNEYDGHLLGVKAASA